MFIKRLIAMLNSLIAIQPSRDSQFIPVEIPNSSHSSQWRFPVHPSGDSQFIPVEIPESVMKRWDPGLLFSRSPLHALWKTALNGTLLSVDFFPSSRHFYPSELYPRVISESYIPFRLFLLFNNQCHRITLFLLLDLAAQFSVCLLKLRCVIPVPEAVARTQDDLKSVKIRDSTTAEEEEPEFWEKSWIYEEKS